MTDCMVARKRRSIPEKRPAMEDWPVVTAPEEAVGPAAAARAEECHRGGGTAADTSAQGVLAAKETGDPVTRTD